MFLGGAEKTAQKGLLKGGRKMNKRSLFLLSVLMFFVANQVNGADAYVYKVSAAARDAAASDRQAGGEAIVITSPSLAGQTFGVGDSVTVAWTFDPTKIVNPNGSYGIPAGQAVRIIPLLIVNGQYYATIGDPIYNPVSTGSISFAVVSNMLGNGPIGVEIRAESVDASGNPVPIDGNSTPELASADTGMFNVVSVRVSISPISFPQSVSAGVKRELQRSRFRQCHRCSHRDV